MEETKIPKRSEIPEKYTWNAPSVFPRLEEWEQALKELPEYIQAITNYKGRLNEGPEILKAAFKAYDDLFARAGKVLVYANMSHSVDTTDQEGTRMIGKAFGALSQAIAGIAFIDPELIAIGENTLCQWIEKDPDLAVFKFYIDNLFRKQAHIRSSEVEELFGMMVNPMGNVNNTVNMLTNADMRFAPARTRDGNEVPVTHSTFDNMMSEQDRELRRTAYESYTDNFLAFKNTLASNLNTSIKFNVLMSRARHFPNSLEASLFESNIPVQVFHNLIDTFKKNLPTWHRYWAIRRKALGVDELYPYDIWAPLTQKRPILAYEQAVDLIANGLAPMGKEYADAIRRGCLEQRWVDVLPSLGKTDGAFSGGWYGTFPFILMSFDGTIFSLSTLAHELGHSMHSYLTWQNQPQLYSGYSLFVAETASNFHQAMVRASLLNTWDDPDYQISVIEEAMSNFHRYFFIMPTLARFELEIHQREERGETSSADDMIALMADLFSEGYGNEMKFDRQRVGITWATFGHLYMDYYVYAYATGISGANYLSRRILNGEPGAVEAYLGFLKSGGSQYPLDILKQAGVDLTSPEPVEGTFAILGEMVDKLERLTVNRQA